MSSADDTGIIYYIIESDKYKLKNKLDILELE
jgi:hypothetical protein